MKQKLAALWAKIVDNKQIVIKTGGAVAGAILGVVVTVVVSNAMSQQPFYEEMDNQIDALIRETE